MKWAISLDCARKSTFLTSSVDGNSRGENPLDPAGIHAYGNTTDNHEMSSYKEKKRKLQEEEAKAKEVTSVIVQFQTADVFQNVFCVIG